MNTSLNGLSLNETMIDVLGNNIANAGTIGFKASDVKFQTQFARTLSIGSAPTTFNYRVGTATAVDGVVRYTDVIVLSNKTRFFRVPRAYRWRPSTVAPIMRLIDAAAARNRGTV